MKVVTILKCHNNLQQFIYAFLPFQSSCKKYIHLAFNNVVKWFLHHLF